MNELQITITGKAGTGKTSLALIIRQFLKSHIRVLIEDMDIEVVNGSIDESLIDKALDKIENISQKSYVKIITKQIKR